MRCVCNRFMKTTGTNHYRCKCGLSFESRTRTEGIDHVQGSDGNLYIAVNNKLELKPREEKKMSFLKTNSNEAGGFGVLTPGEYEVVISEVQKKTSQAGNDVLNLTLTVRSNVDQLHQKRKIFDSLTVTEKAMFKFHNLGMALFGEGSEFGSLDEFKKAITNQYVRVLIKTKTETYQGQTKDKDVVVTYMPSATEGGSEGASDPWGNDGRPIDVSDEELPF